MVSGVQEGDSVICNCDTGYRLSGSRIRVCQANGQWSDTQPSCQRELIVLINTN